MAIRFNGGEYARRTTGLPSSTNPITLAGWAKGTPVNSWYQYWGFDGSGGAYLYVGWAGTTWELAVSGSWASVTGDPSNESWFYYGLTDNGTNSKLYLWRAGTDTAFQEYSVGSANFAPTAISLGCNVSGEYMDSAHAHVKIWTAALTASELQQEMWSIRPRRTANLHLWSPFFNDAKDYSGNARDWTTAGSPTYEDGPPVGWGAGVQWVQAASVSSSGLWVPGYYL